MSQLNTRLTVSKENNLNILKSIKEGLKYVKEDPIIFSGTLYMFAINIGGGTMGALFIFFLKDYLGLRASQIGIIFTLGSIGSMIAIYMANHFKNISRGKMILFAGFLLGVAQVILAIFPFYGITIFCRMVIQASQILGAVNFFTLRQERAPRHLLGRVVSSTRAIAFLSVPMSGFIAGILADQIGIIPVFLATGCIVLVSTLIGMKIPLYHA